MNINLAFRNLRRGGIYSVINIGGLAIGMAAAMLIMLWVYNQWSYDRFHEKRDVICEVWSNNEHNGSWNWTSKIIGPTLLADYSDIANMTRYRDNEELFAIDDKKLYMTLALADPGFLSMFSFKLLQGDAATALRDPSSVILTQDAAKRLFGDENPVGKTIIARAQYPLNVTGIMADLPGNTRFKFDVLVPFMFLKVMGDYDENWSNYSTGTYVELKEGAALPDVNKMIEGIIREHTDNDDVTEPFLYPMAKWHLYSKIDHGKTVGGRIESVRMFALIALLILLIACINFMNLSTARSEKRAREVGVRKVMGARKGILVRQFIGESILVAAIAAVFAIIIVRLCLPFFNTLMNERIELGIGNIGVWAALAVFVLFTGVLAGSYPAFYLSSFMPIKVLKGVFKGGAGVVTPRKLLIVTQFTLAVILITSTVVIHRQIQYAQGRNTGYDKDQLISVRLNSQSDKSPDLLRQELLRTDAVLSVTRSLSPMTDVWSNTWGMNWKGKDPGDRTLVSRYCVDADWAKTTGVEIIQGRDIDIHTYLTDSTAAILNEAAVKLMGFTDPVGQIVQDNGIDWHVVGVVRDFISESPYEPVKPMMISGPKGWLNILNIKLDGNNRTSDNLAKIEKVLAAIAPDFPFEYKFTDESYANKFKEEQRTGTLATWFAGLAVFISCLGLFGLSAYTAENRRKEIGVRKVLGASVISIASLLSREFMILVSVSLVVALPVAWLAMTKWLGGYTYRTNISWWILASVALLTIGIALLTVCWQALKAATANPVKSIKTE